MVCLDTQVLVWGFIRSATPQRTHMIDRATALIDHLTQIQEKIVVPTVVLAELMMRIPPYRHNTFYQRVAQSFILQPFGVKESAFFGEIWKSYKGHKAMKALQKLESTRDALKADCMIVATAVASGASCIYSHDDDIRKIAQGHIAVQAVPDVL